MRARVALVTVVAALAAPGTATASTASLAPATGDYSSGYTLFVTGGPAREKITVEVATDRATATVTDATGAVAPGDDCAALDAHRARCTVPTDTSAVPGGVTHVDVRLGAGDDELRRVTDPALEGLVVDGGPGDDVLDASRARNVVDPRGHFGTVVLDGGSGVDVLRGSRGDDTLRGGAEGDALHGLGGADDLVGGPGNDLLDGGAGADLADYGARRSPVRVDLARGRGGGPGERDSYRGVEDVTGGRAHDTLLGNARTNRLQGSPTLSRHRGAGDVLAGRGGNDQLFDFGGASRVDGGAGTDELDGLGPGDAVSCGPGGDLVAEAQSLLLVPRSCERLRTQFWDYGSPGVRGPTATIRVTRPPGAFGPTCRVRLSLRTRLGPVLGRATFARAGRIVLRLNRAGRRAAARHAVVVLDAFERCGDTHDVWRRRL